MSLCLHSGAKIVEMEQLHSVGTPAGTPTWTPVSHALIVDSVKSALVSGGANIVKEEHALYNNGDRYFGLLHLGENDGGGNTVVGMRNSHDKTFPVGLSLGNHVFVCDNLSFSGDIVVARKHTRWVHKDLDRLIFDAVAKLGDLRQKQVLRFEAYKNRPLSDMEAHDLMVRALMARIVSGDQVARIVAEWRQPRHEEFAPRNVWSLFNDFTEILKGINPTASVKRTMTLHGLLDSHCQVAV